MFPPAAGSVKLKSGAAVKRASGGGTQLIKDAFKAPGGEEPNTSQFIAARGLAAGSFLLFQTINGPDAVVVAKKAVTPTLEDALIVAEKKGPTSLPTVEVGMGKAF